MSLKDEIREQRKSLKGAGFKKQASWFITYYGWASLLCVALLVFSVLFIRRILTSKEKILSIMMINSNSLELFSDTDAGDIISRGFEEYIGTDTDRYFVQTDMNESLAVSDNTDYQTAEMIFALSASGQLDIMTADPAVFEHYAKAQFFEDLREHLTESEFSRYREQGLLFYSDALDENGETLETHVPTGIICTGSKVLRDVGAYENSECITGIIAGSAHPETGKIFIEYLMSKGQAAP